MKCLKIEEPQKQSLVSLNPFEGIFCGHVNYETLVGKMGGNVSEKCSRKNHHLRKHPICMMCEKLS